MTDHVLTHCSHQAIGAAWMLTNEIVGSGIARLMIAKLEKWIWHCVMNTWPIFFIFVMTLLFLQYGRAGISKKGKGVSGRAGKTVSLTESVKVWGLMYLESAIY